MAKIGTAHIEIKPVLDEAALQQLCDTITARVRAAVTTATETTETTDGASGT